MEQNPNFVREDTCPACGHHLDSATEPLQPLERPGWGSISICINCKTVLRFNPAMKLQLADEHELDAEQLAHIRKIRTALTINEKIHGPPPSVRARRRRGMDR